MQKYDMDFYFIGGAHVPAVDVTYAAADGVTTVTYNDGSWTVVNEDKLLWMDVTPINE